MAVFSTLHPSSQGALSPYYFTSLSLFQLKPTFPLSEIITTSQLPNPRSFLGRVFLDVYFYLTSAFLKLSSFQLPTRLLYVLLCELLRVTLLHDFFLFHPLDINHGFYFSLVCFLSIPFLCLLIYYYALNYIYNKDLTKHNTKPLFLLSSKLRISLPCRNLK